MSFGGFGKNSGPTIPPRAQTPFGHFPRPQPDSSAPQQSPNPRAFGTYERAQSPSPTFDNGRVSTGPNHPSVAPIRAPSRQWVRQSSPTGDFGGPAQTRSFTSGPHDIGTSVSSMASHFQDLGRSQSPVQYTEDFLADPTSEGVKGAPSAGWVNRQNSPTGDFGGAMQKRARPSGPHDNGTSISSKASHFQDLGQSRSPVQYTEDFLADPSSEGMKGNADIATNLHGSVASQRRQSPMSGVASNHSTMNSPAAWGKSQRPALFSHQRVTSATPGSHNTSLVNERKISSTKTIDTDQPTDLSFKDEIRRSSHVSQEASRRPSLSPPKSRSGAGVPGMPDFHYKQMSTPAADGVNGDTFVTKLVSHSVPKRNRSPPAAAAGQISLTRSDFTEDDAERELQAKARRLARFKTELDENEPSDLMKSGTSVTKKGVSSMRTDQSVMGKQKFTGDHSSGSTEDMSQDLDNEDLQSCSIIVGLCPDMCPESERAERERKGDLDRYERLDGDRNQTSRTLAVKKYNRTAEREAELIRPMPILQKTMDYLLALLDQPYDDRFLVLYNFLWDRMRAIRMDLRMQHIFNLGAISMLEQMIRLHIIVMHELCEFSKGEGFSEGFDAHLNIEQMNKTSVELFQLYDDHRKRGIFVPTEKEFRGYYALLKLDKHPGYKVEPAELSLDLAKMTTEMRQTHEVLFARDVARSCRTGNFIAFFRHARKANYLQACLIHAHFSKLRTQALASLHSGLQYNQGLPVTNIANWLGMEGEDIESLLEYHGFVIKEFEEPYMVKEGPFLNAEKDYPTQCSNLVHRKKSRTIVEDILSSHPTVLLSSESKKELQTDKNTESKHVVQTIQTKSPVVASDGVMDIDAFSSPRKGRQVEPPVQTSRTAQPYMENHHRASVSSPKNIDSPKALASFQSHSTQEQPSPMTPQGSSLMPDDGNSLIHSVSHKTPPWNSSIPQFVPVNQPTYFEWAREESYGGAVGSSPEKSSEMVVQSELKALEPDPMSNTFGKSIQPASEVEPGTVSSLQDVIFVKEVREEEFTDVQQKVETIDVASYYDKEIAEAKLKLLLRLWRRRSARKRELREQNRLAANAAMSSLTLGPPIHHNKNKHTPCRKLNIDQAVSQRYEKREQSWERWNVSELVGDKLGEKNSNSECICWKVILYSWLHWGNGDREVRNVTHLTLDQWLRHKLIPSRRDATVDDLVVSAPGMAIWRKWVYSYSGSVTCCLSVIKDVESGNFEKKLVGANALLFPVSDTVPWELQKVQLHNLVMSLPPGACVPLLVLSGSSQGNAGELSCNIVDNLGLEDIDKSRVGSFLVTYVNEREETGQFDGYFSDKKLKEGLMWLASETSPQPVVYRVTLRELVSSQLNQCLDVLELTESDKVGPNQCISVFNDALNLSMNKIVTVTNMNPTGWPCPEIYLLDNSTAEFRAVRQFLPSLGWSSPEEVEPLISALKNFRLHSFCEDLSWLSRGCSPGKDIEDQRQLLQDSLMRYLTQSSNLMNWVMATKEASVMLQKCTGLELHNTEYKVVPSWLLIFRRVFNWQLNSLASISGKAYILEQSHSTNPPFLKKSDLKVSISHYIIHPSLDELVEVSCSPVVSKRVMSSPKTLQNLSDLSLIRDITSSYLAEEENQCSVIQAPPLHSDAYAEEGHLQSITKAEEADSLSILLNQCNILQDEIEKKLSIYF